MKRLWAYSSVGEHLPSMLMVLDPFLDTIYPLPQVCCVVLCNPSILGALVFKGSFSNTEVRGERDPWEPVSKQQEENKASKTPHRAGSNAAWLYMCEVLCAPAGFCRTFSSSYTWTVVFLRGSPSRSPTGWHIIWQEPSMETMWSFSTAWSRHTYVWALSRMK